MIPISHWPARRAPFNLMSGQVGIWNLDGEPVSREILAPMSARLAHRGPDGENFLLRGPAGFAFQTLRVTPESVQEIQPVEHPSGTILLWDGRLDNREELADALPRAQLSRACPDSSLVLAAYAAWGEDCLKRLDGDFALAVFDPAQQRMLLARDVMGGRTLYYCRFGHHFLFASEIKALMAHPQVATAPNEQAVAEWLYRIPDYSDLTRTFFKNIQTIPAGHMLEMSAGREALRRFREFDLGHQLRLKHHEDYVDAYKECFTQAVQKRMRSAFPIAMGVSGGLDSSSIFCMAKKIAEENPGQTQPIFGIAMVPEDARANELPYQTLIEEEYGITLEKIPLQAANMVTPGKRGAGAWHSEGPYLKWDVWSQVARASVKHGARVMLSGFFGDHLLLNPQYLLDLAARGRFITAYRHGKNYFDWWEGLSRQQMKSQLYRDLKGYMVPEWFRPAYHRLRRWAGLGSKDYIPWFSQRLVATASRLKDGARPMPLPGSRAHAKIMAHYLYSRLLELRMDMEVKIEAEFPCETASPFRDRKLVALLMSMPGEVVYRAGARGIHREAMKGILPEAIRLRRTKAMFLEPARRGATEDLKILGPSLASGAAVRLGYLIDGGRLREAMDAMQPALENCTDAILPWLANDLVSLEEWLTAYFPDRKNLV